LTPSVSLGATLGAIAGEMYQFCLPSWAPAQDQRMSVVSAAAFLAVAMNSPVTGLWLLVEFAAQGIGSQDLLAALHGDIGPLVESHLAMGMLIPMATAVVCSTGSVKILTRLWAYLLPDKPEVESVPEPYPNIDYKMLIKRTSPTSSELADMDTLASLPGGDSDTTKASRENSVTSSFPLHLPIEKSERKGSKQNPPRRSFTASFDLDLPELHSQATGRALKFSRLRSVSGLSSSVIHALSGQPAAGPHRLRSESAV